VADHSNNVFLLRTTLRKASQNSKLKIGAIHFFTWEGDIRSPTQILRAFCLYSASPSKAIRVIKALSTAAKTFGTVAPILAIGAGMLLTQTGAQVANQVKEAYNTIRERYNQLNRAERLSLVAALEQFVENYFQQDTRNQCSLFLQTIPQLVRDINFLLNSDLVLVFGRTCESLGNLVTAIRMILRDLGGVAPGQQTNPPPDDTSSARQTRQGGFQDQALRPGRAGGAGSASRPSITIPPARAGGASRHSITIPPAPNSPFDEEAGAGAAAAGSGGERVGGRRIVVGG
jgi:hypothetical protein